jgi:RHS repeat-associated protein
MRVVRGRLANVLAKNMIGVVLAAVAALLAGLAPAVQAAPAPQAPQARTLTPPAVKRVPVPLHTPAFSKAPDLDQTAGRKYTATEARMPAAWSGTVSPAVPARAGQAGAAAVGAGSPAWAQLVAPAHGSYRGPSKVGLRVEPQQTARGLGIDGVVMQVSGLTPGTGSVRAGLSYKGFAQAYGGNYGLRLGLVELPACALTTPQVAACRKQAPVTTVNDSRNDTVSTAIGLPGGTATSPAAALTASASTTVVLAATTAGGEGSAAGTYGATSLKPSGSWAAGGSDGSFTYSYPVSLPGSSSSLVPKVGLDYDSGSVDGQTAATQAQANWAGDGWSTGDSYIEQSFIPCSDNPEGTALPAADQTEDMCYDGNVLTLSLDGSTTSLVYDSSSSTWRLQGDDGATLKKVTTGTGTGLAAEPSPNTTTSDTSYWVLTERDGSSYYFGYNELPGWASGDKIASSVDYEPVYSANSGDPCYSSAGFTSSVCTMPYRWHLDYVTDVHGDAMSYHYHQDTNYYGEDQGKTTVPYVRDSYLTEIDYGFRAGSAYSTTAIPDKILFSTGSRCFASSCPAITSSNSGTATSDYPDVPYDLNCAQGSTCTTYGPTFWSTARLTAITTEQYTGSAWNTVDVYTLNENEPGTSDGTSPTLWLSSVSREGEDTTAGGSTAGITLPGVQFGGQDLANRVDTANFPGLYRYRIDQVTGEMGAVTSVTYATPYTCTAAYVDGMTTNAEAASNTESCYPVWWTPPDYTAPVLDWFEKYAVTAVTTTDQTTGGEAQSTQYAYSGGAAWHYDDNEVVKAKYRTYGQFRGYGTVETLTGAGTAGEPQAESATTYYRGMSDDNNTTAVTLTDSQLGHHDDANQLAGKPLETTVYNGDGGPVDHSTIYSYWISPATATRTRSGLPALTANMVEPAETWTRQAITDGGTTTWRIAEADTTYDATVSDADFGLPLYAYQHTVPASTAYDRCTATTYAPANTSENLVGLVASTETDSVACSGFTEGTVSSAPSGLNTLGAPSSVSRPAQVVSARRTFYDDTTWSTTFPQATAPTAGNVTMTRKASGYASGAFTWQTLTRAAAYDSYGRPGDSYDGNGNETVTAYTVNAAGLTTAEKVTNPLSQSVASTLDPERGLTLTATDANGVVTTEQYDALGRLTSVWLDSRFTPTTPPPANYLYTYTVLDTGVSGTVAETLGDSLTYAETVTILDSLGRARETQANTPQGGRLITVDYYDSRGWTYEKVNRFWDPGNLPALGAPVLPTAAEQYNNDYDEYTFNGLGQVVQDTSYDTGTAISTTTTVYNGDRTTVIPPAGGTVTSTVTDPLGRTSETDEYTVRPTVTTPSSTFTGTWYVSGGTSAATTYGYDGNGNQDPVTDKGGSTWTTTYNLLNEVTGTTGPDTHATSGMTYDGNGNLLQETTAEGTVSFTYDALNRKTGQYAAATSAQVAYVSSSSPGNEMASWVYDNANNAVTSMKYPIGHETTQTTYSGGQPWVIQQSGFNVFGEPTGEKYTIPATTATTGLSGTYTFGHAWTVNTGLPDGQYYPAVTAAGLPAETTSITYLASALNLAKGISSGIAGYAQTSSYDQWGDITSEEIGSGTSLADINSAYDQHTLNLDSHDVQRSVGTPQAVDSESYTYDLYGNVTSQASQRLGSSAGSETQCYQYDGLDQLTQAWTAASGCATTPTSSNVTTTVGDGISTAAAYWTTWSYDTTGGNAATDVLGEMTSADQHALTTGGTDVTTTNTFGGANGGPHALTTAAATGGTTSTSTFKYDAAGNMISRDVPSTGNQALTWNAAGQLTSVSAGTGKTTSYVYAPDGTLLLQADPGSTSGSTAATLYLDGEQLTATTSGTTTTVTGARIIPLPAGGDVVRTGATTSYYFEIPDPQGTSGLTLDHTAQTPTWRQFTPYGAPRGTTTTWIDNRGFLNKPNDPATGLTYDGARSYDPATSQFTSPDPVLTTANPLDLNPYLYAFGNPIGNSDPTGLCPKDQCGPGINEPGQNGAPVLGTPAGTASVAPPAAAGAYTSDHSAAILDTEVLITVEQMAHPKYRGQITIDLGAGGHAANEIDGGERNGSGDPGYADIILWTKTVDYVWEVKKAGDANATLGKDQLARYIDLLNARNKDDAAAGGDPAAEVVPGFGLMSNVIPSLEFPGQMIRTWSGTPDKGELGLRFYSPPIGGRQPQSQPRDVPVTVPVPVPVANSAPQPYSAQQPNSFPQLGPVAIPGPVATAGAAAAGVGAAAYLVWLFGGLAFAGA